MPEALTEQQLSAMCIDPRETWAHARCPWCGQDLVLGVRVSSRNLTLVHSGHVDPTDPTGTRIVAGCEQFTHVAHRDDVLQTLRSAGVHFTPHTP